MASQQQPQLNQNNRIYLYGLLRSTIGVGRQAFMTQIEEALASDGLDAASLGYDGVRELLEELDEFVTLTVFKGGRVYATLVAQPEWDAILDAAGDGAGGTGATGKSGKPWKRKRGQRTLKPVRPRAVTVESEIEEEAVEAAADEIAEGVDAPAEPEQAPEGEAAAENTFVEAAHVEDAEDDVQEADEAPAAGESEPEPESAAVAEAEPESAPAARPEPAPEPSISLTVIFDPEHANAGIQTLASTPATAGSLERVNAEEVAAIPQSVTASPQPVTASPQLDAASTEPPAVPLAAPRAERAQNAAVAAATPAPQPAQPAPATPGPAPEPPIDPKTYPQDFTTDVWCPTSLLHELSALLPLGADALGIAGEWFLIAIERGTAELGRKRIAFPLRYIRDGERRTATIRLKHRSPAAPGAPWAIEAIEAD